MDWTEIVIASLGGGTVISGIIEIVKAKIDKKKTPYDLLKDLLEEHTKLYHERNADYEREKLDSAEKSSVIMQSHFCKHKYKDPEIVCPVDTANDERLKKRCERCSYGAPDPQDETEE